MNPIKLPVTLNDRMEIVDGDGAIVFPAISWKADYYHLKRQKEVGEFVVQLINNGDSSVGEPMVIGVENGHAKNPWGRKGKPK
jgi:hypothetical protein